MTKKLRCVLGIHDWHVIKSVNKHRIEESVAEELDPCQENESRPCVSYVGPGASLSHKICLDCEKEVNTIPQYREKYKQRMLRIQELGGKVLPKKYKLHPRTKGTANNDMEG